MKFEIDDIKKKAITSQVFSKTVLLKHIDPNIDGDYRTSFAFLNSMCEGEPESLRDRVIASHAKICISYKMGNAFVNPTFAVCHFLWGRIYVWAYYFKHNDSLWQQHILPLMMELQKSAKIKEDMHRAEQLLETYFEEQSQYEKAIKESKLSISSTAHADNTQTDCMPDIIQTMQDINAGKIAYTNIDWELQIKTVLKLINLMPTHFSNVIWLWGFLAEIDDINKRIDILHKMQEVATKCFEDLFLASDFIKDCDCLIYVYQGSLLYKTQNIGLRHYWTDDKKHLNDLAHILCKEMVDPKFMVAMAEEMYCTIPDSQRKHPMLELVLHASRNIDRLTMTNIVDFAKNLYIAEGFRHLILSGEEDYMDIPALSDFEPKLLKACFEVYIRLRTIDIKDIIEQDLTHCGDAEELECLEYLFEEESQHVNRENMLEDFRGSAAYNAMWYPGKQKVFDMINVFVEYLKNKIKKLKKEEAKLGIRDNIQNFNVQGDYIAGDKHVGAHIDNVSPGAIGTQTTKD
ncbi:hypothetical protein [Pseudobutyrivibrio sp.]|uniref:hypothetical protein n=1 Tax=Pseudobutyrivibrio sp. TaxID=2014367 RepID=UPI00386E425C